MRKNLRRLGQTLAAVSAMLAFTACGSTSGPTAPMATSAAMATAATAAQQRADPLLIRGVVVDSSGRPLANVNLECMGDVQCVGVAADPDVPGLPRDRDHAALTKSDGSYQFIAEASGGFVVGANASGYGAQFRNVESPDPACTTDNPSCVITVDFTLTAELE